MKFAKELEQDAVPEWRIKYLDYKSGKKKVKAVAKALKAIDQTPRTPGRRKPPNLSPFRFSQRLTPDDPLNANSRIRRSYSHSITERTPLASARGIEQDNGPHSRSQSPEGEEFSPIHKKLPPLPTQTQRSKGEDVNNTLRPGVDREHTQNYGSFIRSPPSSGALSGPSALELPEPALSAEVEDLSSHRNRTWWNIHGNKSTRSSKRLDKNTNGDAYKVGRTHTPTRSSSALFPKHRKRGQPRRTFSIPDGLVGPHRKPILSRLFSNAKRDLPPSPDVQLEAYKQFDLRQAEFFNFLDDELLKIETFYKSKEVEARDRLRVLRQQLHEMRDRRLQEVAAAQQTKEPLQLRHGHGPSGNGEISCDNASKAPDIFQADGPKWIRPIEHAIGFSNHHFGKNTKALMQMASPLDSRHERTDMWRDFGRRVYQDEVSYKSAKRKLKIGLQEFYRGLELLKSYALLNRTAFRKINKKYDKAVHARPTGRYMSEKINNAWFVKSDLVESQLVVVEDLYARYFERGNRKIAIGKLRTKSSRAGDYTASVFRNGFWLAAGTTFGVQGLIYGIDHLSSSDPGEIAATSYLLQVYGGYFLGLFLFLLFCLACRTWTRAKINYIFIFEFDTQHNLDWRQLAELPCFLLFLLGLFLWLNFQQSGTDAMFIYWPLMLVGLTLIILLFPGPILYHRSRKWWAYSNFRLLLAGLYPVEFRDFFLGDMYCSLTYAMGNVELFFCLYARGWNDPGQCNSTHSRLLGFFSTLPGIWRALQCLRRYHDTRNVFPHLVNCGKYTCTILFYMSLSLYRIDQSTQLRVLFIFFATVNSIYCSIWDVAMDWSLCNPYAKNRYLRDVLGYKNPSVYYFAMIVDPLLRFNWIFYAIFTSELQHSAVLSFLIGFTEICRRGMWSLFRVENEHCTNVGRFRASRDVPLPYDIPSPTISTLGDSQTSDVRSERPLSDSSAAVPSRPHTTSGADLESAGRATPSSGFRRRQPPGTPSSPGRTSFHRVGTIITEAHAQDFERRRKPDVDAKEEKEEEGPNSRDSSGDEDDEDTTQELLDAQGILSRHKSATMPL